MKYYFLLLIIIVKNFSNLLWADDNVIEDNLTIFNRLTGEIIGQAIANVNINVMSLRDFIKVPFQKMSLFFPIISKIRLYKYIYNLSILE